MELLYLGLMSGTSLDGIDAALVRLDQSSPSMDASLEAFRTIPFSRDQRASIEAALAGGSQPAASVRELARLNRKLGEWFADAALELLNDAGVESESVAAVGSHGQTIWHEPPAKGGRSPGSTLQLGEAAVIAERLGVPVVSDFRARDVAAGGQGAPLVPLVDRVLFSSPDRHRALQNIGGMANVSFLPAGSASPSDPPPIMVAFDTGPGVAVIDRVVQELTDGVESFDRDGRRAAAAQPNQILLARLLDDAYFREPPPKSTGREYFGGEYALRLIDDARQIGIEEEEVIVATATALTAHSIADAYRCFAPRGQEPQECFVSGGGARNPTLMGMLSEQLSPMPVADLSKLGWDPDAKEAVAFAILAHLFQQGLPGNVPSVTGARGPRILGKLSPA